jgi:hypothetical protein
MMRSHSMPRQNRARVLALLSAAWLSWTGDATTAAELPARTVPGNVGVNAGVTALGLDDQDFLKMGKAGLRYVRFDLIWDEIERTKGVYEWQRFDQVMAKLKEHGFKPLLILDYGNSLYDPASGGIRTDEAREGYANFAAAAVARYNQQIHGTIWEIWNEPNSNDFWKPKRDADEYVALVKTAVPAMRRADPTATIISGGILELFWNVTQDYLERCFELAEVDGLGVHLYGGRRNIHPERIIEELAELRKRMAAYGARADYPILNTEFGAGLEEYEKFTGMPEQQELGQAETYIRMYLLCLLEDVRLNIWYEWQWEGGFSGHAILNADGSPRAAYRAIAAALDQLNGYTFEKQGRFCPRLQEGKPA